MFLSGGTVRNYVSKIIQKLEAKNRIEAIGIAEKNGWLG
ncbi:LuxR C-terminal-related transcriptional regulator [Paenibacillus piri]